MFPVILISFFLLFPNSIKAQGIKPSKNSLITVNNQKLLTINKIIFGGNTVFSDSELTQVTQNFLQQNLSTIKIQEIMIKVREFYREKGYLNADVYAQEGQSLTEGIVQIFIDEGILEQIEIKGLTSLDQAYIRERLPFVNSPLNIHQLEKALTLLEQNQLLFSDISSTLTRGTRPNSSILTINVVENNRFNLKIEANNYGAFNSGENQLETSVKINNLVGYGDRLKTEFNLSEGSEQILFDYYLPFAPKYGEIRFHYDYGESEIITPPLAQFEIKGIYQQGFLEWRLPVKEEIREKWFVSLNVGVENSRNFVRGEPFSFVPQVPDSGYTIYNLRLATDYFNSFPTSAIATRGELTLAWDSLANTNDPLTILRFQSNYLHQIQERILFSGKLAAQFSTGSLAGSSTFGVLPSEQFPLGGIETVPGYDLYLRRGDNGVNLSAQIYGTILDEPDWGRMQLVPFVAYGQVWNESFPLLEPTNLASTGIEWHWNVRDWDIRLGVAFGLTEVEPDFERPFYFSVGKNISF
jgi:hemolysin activation/secretion protein